MGRLWGGTHEITGIKAPLFLHEWVVGGFSGVGGWVVVGGGWWVDGWVGLVVRVRAGGMDGKRWGWVGG